MAYWHLLVNRSTAPWQQAHQVSSAAQRLKSFLSGNRAFFVHLALIVLSAWLVFNWYETVRRIIASYLPLPFMDYWRVVLDYPQWQAHDFRFLWNQHNEHRILFPEIVFLLDMSVWHGKEYLPLAVSFLCYFSIWVVIAWTLAADNHLSCFHRALPILLTGIVIGWKGSASALPFPFLLQWTLTQFCAIAALFLITDSKGRNRWLTLAITSTAIATYSSGNGMLLWPVLVIAGFLLRLTKLQILALIASAVVSVGLYFVGYRFSHDLNLANFIRHPLYSLSFIGVYLSMPFGNMKSPTFGVYIGLANLAIAIGLFAYAARERLLPTRQSVVLFGTYCFTLLTALITAAGRMDVADDTFTAAKADRYVTVPLVNWAVLISLTLWLASRRRWRIAPAPVLAFCFAVLLAIGCLQLRAWLRTDDEYFADAQAAMLSIEDDLDVPELMKKDFPDPRLIRAGLPLLRRDHLSIYYKGRTRWLGQPASRYGPLATGSVSGAVTKTVPVSGGLEVFGWADDRPDVPRYRWIVLVNDAGQIAGFGERFPAGPVPNSPAPNTPRSLSWIGFVNLRVGSASFHAYLIDPDRRGLFPIPASQF
ncbi:MAG TPA: hypothetical protein VFB14_11950 [Bryobacteraceae bacterium]|nr:hypothetical protein [Bryobacteraceae bacterium]